MKTYHLVDIPKFLDEFQKIKEKRKQIRISRDYLHRLLTALKSELTPDEIIILRARLDGQPFSIIAKEIQKTDRNGKVIDGIYTRMRISQMEKEAILKITRLQEKKKQRVKPAARFLNSINEFYEDEENDILEEPTPEQLEEIEKGKFK